MNKKMFLFFSLLSVSCCLFGGKFNLGYFENFEDCSIGTVEIYECFKYQDADLYCRLRIGKDKNGKYWGNFVP